MPPLVDLFAQDIRAANQALAEDNARLLPTAMHPWMDPHSESKIWPHEYNDIYHAYDALFDCRGHGWSNLQSTHINLPFTGDDEFGRLHAAIRLVLPLIPGLSASSPFYEDELGPFADNRLHYYLKNQKRIPVITGLCIPEAVFTQADYQQRIYDPIRRALELSHAPDALNPVFVNSRGAIEIRLIDIQECPLADLAICHLLVETIRALTEEHWSKLDTQKKMPTPRLRAIAAGSNALVSDHDYLKLFGLGKENRITAQGFW